MSFCPSVCPSVRPSAVCLSICLSVYLSISLSLCLLVSQSINLSVCSSICLSVYLSVYLSIYLSAYTFPTLATQDEFKVENICRFTFMGTGSSCVTSNERSPWQPYNTMEYNSWIFDAFTIFVHRSKQVSRENAAHCSTHHEDSRYFRCSKIECFPMTFYLKLLIHTLVVE